MKSFLLFLLLIHSCIISNTECVEVLFSTTPIQANQSNGNTWTIFNTSNNCASSIIASFSAAIPSQSSILHFYGWNTTQLNSYGQVSGANITLIYVINNNPYQFTEVTVGLFDSCGNKVANPDNQLTGLLNATARTETVFHFDPLSSLLFNNFQVRLEVSRTTNTPGSATWSLKCLRVILYAETNITLTTECPPSPLPDNTGRESTTSDGSSNIAVIAGSAVGAFVGLAVLVGIITFFFVRKRKKDSPKHPDSTAPVTMSVSSYSQSCKNIRAKVLTGSALSVTNLYITDVQLKELLGRGKFGEVYEGLWHGTTAVACKKLKSKDEKEFENEIGLLMKLNHPNVVRCLGIYNHQPTGEIFMVLELLRLGSLSNFLRNPDSKNRLTVANLVEMCLNAASGMVFLEQKNIVHRDLGARNLLVTESDGRYVVKISDFGLSRQVEENDAIYSSKEGVFPVKWSPPEVINFRQFTSKSDVWSFGITVWEIFEAGKVPYPNLSNNQAAEKVLQGYRLPKPAACPDEVYKLMQQCWSSKPEERPNFKWLHDELQKIYSTMKGGEQGIKFAITHDDIGYFNYNTNNNNGKQQSFNSFQRSAKSMF